jgi:L-alanine-DL-glutamate epimerase-like enolase superfamily enzyme
VEYRGGDCPWWEDVVILPDGSGPILEDGHIEVPDGPGLGVDIDPDRASEYLVGGSDLVF